VCVPDWEKLENARRFSDDNQTAATADGISSAFRHAQYKSLPSRIPRFLPLPIHPFETISSSGLINPTDGIGVRYQLKMMKPNGAARWRAERGMEQPAASRESEPS